VTKIELAKCSNLAHNNGALLKVIVETAYLSDPELERACKICADAGADFVKTSTGFAPSGAKVEI
jgi:deoxyribose-phosphate aldolase